VIPVAIDLDAQTKKVKERLSIDLAHRRLFPGFEVIELDKLA